MEICMLAKCSKIRGVIRLLDWYSIPEGFLIVMERPYPCIDMFDFIKGQGKISEEMAHFLFRQITVTVHECVQNRVLHRDLKDENVVIDLVTGSTKLIDFGAATVLRRSQYSDFQGTRLYCPPEWFLHSLYLGREAAVWSLGVLLYNSLNGRLPFRNEKDICTAHLLGPLPFFVPVSSEVKDLISKCLTFDPFQRCSLEAILNHPWVKQQPLSWELLTKNKVQKKTSMEKSDDHISETLGEQSETEEERSHPTTVSTSKQPGTSDEGVGLSASSSHTPPKKQHKEHRMAKTSLLAPPTSVEMKAAVQASKTPTQFNVHTALKNQRQIKKHQSPHAVNSTVLTALRRAMSREAQNRISGVFLQD
ncbi:hypothetical protein L5515_004582 [Caenorhabditis briggsae]|nr:hypothetical protein L5515_004582 [Caenorhabditis briggsae]